MGNTRAHTEWYTTSTLHTPPSNPWPGIYACVPQLSVHSWLTYHATYYKSRPFVFNKDPNSYNDRFVYCQAVNWNESRQYLQGVKWKVCLQGARRCLSAPVMRSKQQLVPILPCVPSPYGCACLYVLYIVQHNTGGQGSWVLYSAGLTCFDFWPMWSSVTTNIANCKCLPISE